MNVHHANVLRSKLEAACSLAASLVLLDGCCIGRSYGPATPQRLVTVNATLIAQANIDGSLPLDVCREVCPQEGLELTGCHSATLTLTARPKRRRLLWEYRSEGSERFLQNGTEAPPDVDQEQLEDAVDPEVCLRFHRRGTHSATPFVRNCRLETKPAPAPPPGSPMVQCHFYRPGGCDTGFSQGRDTCTRRGVKRGYTDASSWLVRAAQEERTSVRAFAEIAKELRRFGAPPTLSLGAYHAKRDEVRHAKTMTRLAQRRLAHVPRLRFARMKARSLEAFALENAIEGCVRELFAAAIAVYQGRNASSSVMRKTFETIARDETRHAALALRILEWSLQKLDASSRARILSAIENSVADTMAKLVTLGEGIPELGLPNHAAARTLALEVERTVWRPLITSFEHANSSTC